MVLTITLALGPFFVSAVALPLAFHLAIPLAVLLLVFAVVVVAPLVATVASAPSSLSALVLPGIGTCRARHTEHCSYG